VAEEKLIRQRKYIDAAYERAIQLTPPVEDYGNPLDWNTMVQIRAAQEIAMSFCNVKDHLGTQLGSSIDEVAQRCVNAESGSKAQSKLIAEMQEQIERLEECLRNGGPGRGKRG
jgi:hypothetical protein